MAQVFFKNIAHGGHQPDVRGGQRHRAVGQQNEIRDGEAEPDRCDQQEIEPPLREQERNGQRAEDQKRTVGKRPGLPHDKGQRIIKGAAGKQLNGGVEHEGGEKIERQRAIIVPVPFLFQIFEGKILA